jgi:hypothetical protein
VKIITPLNGVPDSDGFYARAELDDGTELGLVPLFGGRARVTVGRPSRWSGFDEGW